MFYGMVKEELVEGLFMDECIVAPSSDLTRDWHQQSRFGELQDGKFLYSLVEGLYLLEKKRLLIVDGRGKELDFDTYLHKVRRKNKDFWVNYMVYKDMRDRGFIVKTALKFGAEFRVYDRGIKPGDDHAKWILYTVHESNPFTWHDFSAKNRVAHSTRKKLLIGVVDDEGEVTYYEVGWIRP